MPPRHHKDDGSAGRQARSKHRVIPLPDPLSRQIAVGVLWPGEGVIDHHKVSTASCEGCAYACGIVSAPTHHGPPVCRCGVGVHADFREYGLELRGSYPCTDIATIVHSPVIVVCCAYDAGLGPVANPVGGKVFGYGLGLAMLWPHEDH